MPPQAASDAAGTRALQTQVRQVVHTLEELQGVQDAFAVHAALWPFVRDAVSALRPAGPVSSSGARDRRVRRWQYSVRFWDAAGELVGETDPEVMNGTGSVPLIIEVLARQLHGTVPAELLPEAVRTRLPQLRNNLGRSSRAALRIPYAHGDDYMCQMDIQRLEG